MGNASKIAAGRRKAASAERLATMAMGGDSEHLFVEPEKLVNRADNRPVDESAVRAIADSILQEGLGQPVLARVIPGDAGHYELVAGQHRRAAYLLLQREHPDDARWKRIECIVRRDMDDETAFRLMLATNVMNSELTPAQRGEMFAQLGRSVPAMREKDPSLAGKKTSEIVADMVEQAGGVRPSSRTIERGLRAAADEKRAAAADAGLIDLWRREFDANPYKVGVRADIAQMELESQHRLYERWEDAGKSRTWLGEEIAIIHGDGASVALKAAGALKSAVSLLERARAAGAALPEGAAEAASRLDALVEASGEGRR